MSVFVFLSVLVLAAWSSMRPGAEAVADARPVPSQTTGVPTPGPIPTGAEGALITYGRDIIQDTPRYAGGNIKAGMSCEACHLSAGTKARGGSFRGIYAQFPQYNARSHRFIALQDRLAECFLYSMNGTPPAYTSRTMIALTAYIAYLSRGAVVGAGFAGQGLEKFSPDHAPSISAGAKIYANRCSACHGASGQGVATFPPLWGPKSFNNGAGMHRLSTMSGFVRYNMPFGSPHDTLSTQEAYDVSAYVLSHPRPAFSKKRMIAFPAQAAGSF